MKVGIFSFFHGSTKGVKDNWTYHHNKGDVKMYELMRTLFVITFQQPELVECVEKWVTARGRFSVLTASEHKYSIELSEPMRQDSLKRALRRTITSTFDAAASDKFHLRVSKEKPASSTINDANVLREQIRAELTVELKTELTEIRDRLERMESAPPVTVAPITNNITNNNLNIIINDFGREDVSYLDDPKRYLQYHGTGILRAIEQLHFHPEHPSNHNIRLKSSKRQLAEVMKDGKWQVAPLRHTEDAMIWKIRMYIVRGIDSANIEDANLAFLSKLASAAQNVMSPLRQNITSMLHNKRSEVVVATDGASST